MHIFISYGRADKETFAKKLAAWLREHGHEPWLDVEQGIPPGHPFDVRIEQGIHENEILLAVLSPWSVRPESFCRNEILYAQTLKKTVLPVRMADVIPPIQIISLNYVDACARPDDIFSLLSEALDIITETGTWQPYALPDGKPWYESGEELDFQEDLVRFGTGFVGRDWLFEDLKAWIREPTSRVCLLVAGVGIGKSAIAARLTTVLDVKGIHFCTRSLDNSCKPVPWIRALIRQLARQLPAYRAILDSITEPPNWDQPAASLFRDLVSNRLVACEGGLQVKEPWVFVIDALDEADPAMVTFLTETIDRVPPWIRLVLTSRPDETTLARFRLPGVQERRIGAGDVHQRGDVNTFLEQQYQALVGTGILPERPELLERFEHLADGNFHYASVLMAALGHPDPNQRLQVDEVGTLPGNLGGLYDRLFRRRFGNIDQNHEAKRRYKEDVRPLLDCLAAAPAPVPESLLIAAAGGEDEEVAIDGLQTLSQFLIHEHDTYRFFHESVREWLTENRVGSPFGAYPSKGHRYLVEAYARMSLDGWASGPDDGYFLQHLCGHLVAAGRRDEAVDLLMDAPWIERSVNAGLIHGLIEAYNLFLTQLEGISDDVARALRLVQGALRLSQHVLAPHPEELPSQLHGRLVGGENQSIQHLLEELRARTRHTWLRPITASLTAPGGPLIRTLAGHTDWVNAVAITPDGKTIASGSGDNSVKVWNLKSGQERRTFAGHTGSVWAVALTPDGRTIVSVSRDRTVKAWDLETGGEIRTLQGHSEEITSVAVTPDGTTIVSGSSDGTVKVWDLASGRERRTLAGHTDPVTAVAVTPDGKTIVSGSWDKTVKVWDLTSGQQRHTLAGHTEWVTAVVVTPDGKTIVSGSRDGFVKLWDLASGLERCTLASHTGWVRSLAVTPDGKTIVSGSSNGTVTVLDLTTGQELVTLAAHTKEVTGVAVAPDGKTIVSGSWDMTVKIWDMATNRERHTLASHSKEVTGVVVAPGGKTLVSGSWDKTVKVWDLASGQERATLTGHTKGVTSLAVTPDGTTIVSGSRDITIKLWDLGRGLERRTLAGHTDRVTSVAVTPDGTTIVSGSWDKTLKVWEVESGRDLRTLVGHTMWVTAVAVTPDGTTIVSGSDDNTVRVWDLASGRERHILAGHTQGVTAVAVTPDGTTIVSGSDDNTVKVWDLASGQERRTLAGHTASIGTVAVTPDGTSIVSASLDKTVKIWDLESGAPVTRFSTEGSVYASASSGPPDIIVVGDSSGAVHILRLENRPGAPSIVTGRRHTEGGEPSFPCPYCGLQQVVPDDALGTVVTCPSCTRLLKLNPFVVELWRP